jgi:hypothetical protein
VPSYQKIRKILDPEHLEYVRRQSCVECRGAPLSLDPQMTAGRARVSDPHHLRNTTHPRRFFDWLCVPLCRMHHARVDSLIGNGWERGNWTRWVRVAGNLLYRNGRISALRFKNLVDCGDNVEEVRAWIDTLILDGQNWEGGEI